MKGELKVKRATLTFESSLRLDNERNYIGDSEGSYSNIRYLLFQKGETYDLQSSQESIRSNYYLITKKEFDKRGNRIVEGIYLTPAMCRQLVDTGMVKLNNVTLISKT